MYQQHLFVVAAAGSELSARLTTPRTCSQVRVTFALHSETWHCSAAHSGGTVEAAAYVSIQPDSAAYTDNLAKT